MTDEESTILSTALKAANDAWDDDRPNAAFIILETAIERVLKSEKTQEPGPLGRKEENHG